MRTYVDLQYKDAYVCLYFTACLSVGLFILFIPTCINKVNRMTDSISDDLIDFLFLTFVVTVVVVVEGEKENVNLIDTLHNEQKLFAHLPKNDFYFYLYV